MAQRIAGVCYVKVDGAQLAARGNWMVSPLTVQRAGIAGQDGIHGYSEEPKIPYIEGDVSTMVEGRVEELTAVTDSTVTIELANGTTYTLRNAWFSGDLTINAKDGSYKVKFEGIDCIEFV
jgi:hypothetical protein